MKYKHMVKHNGNYYPAGADVPEKSPESKDEKGPEKGLEKK